MDEIELPEIKPGKFIECKGCLVIACCENIMDCETGKTAYMKKCCKKAFESVFKDLKGKLNANEEKIIKDRIDKF